MSEATNTIAAGLIDTNVRIASWNVWGNFGPWRQRYPQIHAELRGVGPDVICLQEAWRADGHDAADALAKELGYQQASVIEWYEPLKLESGAAILSRWEIVRREGLNLPAEGRGGGAVFQFVEIAGPRGPLPVFNAMLDWRPDLSQVRQNQVKALCAWIRERRVRGAAVVLCGDFNAGPDSDEIRMLTGKSGAPEPGLVFWDAWEAIRPEERGLTWSNSNAFASSFPLPDRRIDYIFSAWGAPRGLGQPRACELMGTEPDRPASDHYGVWADLGY